MTIERNPGTIHYHQNRLRAWAMILFSTAFVTTLSAQTLTTLAGFDGTNGSSPQSSLVQGADGNFYGVTEAGGANNQGTFFKMSPQGQLTTMYSFCSLGLFCPDGAAPLGGLVQGADGNFYGTTAAGGGTANTWGTVFKISGQGSLTTLHSFQFVDGATPRGTLVQGSDGNLYGTTWQGGVNSGCFDGNERACGTIFKITPDGQFTTLYSFCSQSGCSDGADPVAGLVQGSDGEFYGTTYIGGTSPACADGCGTVFKITPTGALTTLHTFCLQSGCPDGMLINAGLVQGSDGNFYGASSQGGSGKVYQLGTIFKITPNGQFTTLYSFCSQAGCAEGGMLLSALVQGHAGNFYGTTVSGAKGAGTVFTIRSSDQLTRLYTFCSVGVYPLCQDGDAPVAALVQGSDGMFYGTTKGHAIKNCTDNNCGTIFRFGVGLNLQPSSGPVGTKIKVVGLNLSGASSVRFNGVPAAFTISSATQISTSVPGGASTGTVRVTTPGGVLLSTSPFVVTPHITSFKPTSGPVGTVVTITGTTFTHATQVTFGGVSATSFAVDSGTQITATVPVGAVTGTIDVTTSGGTAVSSGTYTVTN
jgi:uncharacterized repeat protein (TIGR03803 family)